MVEEFAHAGLLVDLCVTLARVASAFAAAMLLGTALGIALGRWPRLDLLLDGPLIALLNLPALVLIVLTYVWLGLNETALIIAVALNKLPSTVVTLREGARSLDPDLADMARLFRMGIGRRLRHVVLPQLAPYMLAATRSGLAVVWKIALVAELLGASNGIGFRIQGEFQLFDVTRILADTLAFVLVVQGIEWALLRPLDRHVSRWRT